MIQEKEQQVIINELKQENEKLKQSKILESYLNLMPKSIRKKMIKLKNWKSRS